MITEISYDKDLLGKEVRGTNTSYWGYISFTGKPR